MIQVGKTLSPDPNLFFNTNTDQRILRLGSGSGSRLPPGPPGPPPGPGLRRCGQPVRTNTLSAAAEAKSVRFVVCIFLSQKCCSVVKEYSPQATFRFIFLDTPHT